MTVLSYGLSLTNGAFLGPMRIAQGAVKGFTSQLSNVGNIITGFASLPGAISTLLAPLSSPITLSGDMEALETSFKALLKNAPAAKAMVKDLVEFADVTPFDPVPVAATGKALLAFGFAAKEVKPLLKDIGDLAAGMDKPIDEVGDAFGRLKAGQFGEAFERMRAFGISMQDLQGAGLKFDKSGSFKGSAEQALEAVRQIIRRKFGGGMTDLSTTFRGLFSTFQGYWDALQRSFGTPIMRALKPLLEDGTGLLKQWAPIAEDFGKKLATGVLVIREMFQNGTLVQGLGLALQGAGAMLINQLFAGFQGLVSMFATGLAEAVGVIQKLLSESALWEGIGAAFKAGSLPTTTRVLSTPITRRDRQRVPFDLRMALLLFFLAFAAIVAGLSAGHGAARSAGSSKDRLAICTRTSPADRRPRFGSEDARSAFASDGDMALRVTWKATCIYFSFILTHVA